MKQLCIVLFLLLSGFGLHAQVSTTCPAPNPGDPSCYQTSRPSQGNPLTNWPPIPNQDCCNAIPLCLPYNIIENGVVIPEGAPGGTLYPGCVEAELPDPANTCFGNNEKGTTWFKFQIRPLNMPGAPTAPGSPAGKLRFKIIPKDVFDLPDYDPFTDDGSASYGNTDYDFLLFKIPANATSDGGACTIIRNSPTFGAPGSVIASCNWTGTRGPTGLFEPGTGTEMAQGPATRFNKPLNVKVGDIFYLAIDNFSVNVNGFDVDFRGLEAPDDSTAIVNPPPTDSIKIKRVVNPVCSDRQFKIVFDKPIVCDSVKPGKFTVLGLLPNLSVASIAPENGCNSGGQDTAFVFTLQYGNDPALLWYDTTLQMFITQDIRDLCGNKVLLESIRLRQEYPVPLQVNQIQGLPADSLGINQFILAFSKPVYCDSVKTSKFSITGLLPGLSMSSIQPLDSCGANGLDSLFLFTISSSNPDTTLRLSVTGIINGLCNPVAQNQPIPFRIEYASPFFIEQPVNASVQVNETAKFWVTTTDPSVPRVWQRDDGAGFINLSDVGQFSGTSTDTLTISFVQNFQNNLVFRCRFLPSGGLPQFFSQSASLNISSVRELKKPSPLQIFPNPVSEGELHLKGRASHFRLYSVLGRLELEASGISGAKIISISELPAGMYFAEVENDGLRWISKLQVN